MVPEFISPSFIEENDPDTIHKRMLEALPSDIDDMPGGFPWDFTRPTANIKSELIQFHLVQTIMMMFPAWSWGEYLDLHASAAGLSRKQGGKARGKVTVEGAEGTVIPKGTIFVTLATETTPSVEFETEEEGVVGTEGEIEIDVAAIEAGIIGNVPGYTITLMSKPIKGISAINNMSSIAGGTEEEDDEALRERVQEVNEEEELSFTGNNGDYRRWAKEVVGVGDATVIAEWNGPSTVKLIITDSNGQPANEFIIQSVIDYIMSDKEPLKRLAPIGAILTVTAPTVLSLSYSGRIVLTEEYNMEEVKNNFRKNLLEYYKVAKEERTLKYNKVHAVLSDTEGIADFTEFKINGAVENIILEESAYPETTALVFMSGG